MTRFAILLGGDLTATPRLKGQIRGARVIAADSGMMHASTLGVVPELWVGDFDSAGSELTMQYRDVPRETFPAEKDATDGAIAVEEAIRRGASQIMLLGGLGGQTDHTAGLLGQSVAIARRGVACMLTSGTEEAWPLIGGRMVVDLPPETRLSIIPFTDLLGLDLEGVKWPLSKRDVPVGSTLTLSNVALGPVAIRLVEGHGVAIAYPPQHIDG
ncbi:thiamine diphosphokinase [Aestuariivirga sp.]|uniref:thiamine diphosphokinase n=1 Tax=Aestuariivirga sp. TaxID=2650926 RepID=UPI0025BA478F|nr:thiamine diphosphokinase [Aestuariivirga sp.]MCA3556262.1 thiamine diphosphokinase [Aestuariivirga sp.]